MESVLASIFAEPLEANALTTVTTEFQGLKVVFNHGTLVELPLVGLEPGEALKGGRVWWVRTARETLDHNLELGCLGASFVIREPLLFFLSLGCVTRVRAPIIGVFSTSSFLIASKSSTSTSTSTGPLPRGRA